jgi:integrase
MGRANTGMAIILKATKTGPNQSVTIQKKCVADLLCVWMRSRYVKEAPESSFVFPFKPDSLRRLMHNACAALNLPPYVPHSLRHGGATHDFLTTNSIEHVQFRGRWKSMESSRRYIQTARALLADQRIPQELNKLAEKLEASIVDTLTLLFDSVSPKATRK